MIIREFVADDWPRLWEFLEPVFRAGETYPYPVDITSQQAYTAWIETPQHSYVAIDKDTIVGSYYIKPNQPGLGSHVCNCGYVVAQQARNQGVGAALGEHSQQTAVHLGYRAMQFNLVVATNTASLHLWQKCGFHIVGTLPEAFHHPHAGYVDAFVMFKQLIHSKEIE